MDAPERSSLPGGPVRPTARAISAHRPLGGHGPELSGGLLRDWQARSRDVSLPMALSHLRTAGNMENLRLAASGDGGVYRGPVFMDSDLYKTLEAIGWEQSRGTTASLSEFTEEAASLLEKAQQPDGYLNSYVQVTGQQRYTQLERSHELYCAGHLLQAAVAHARTGGRPGSSTPRDGSPITWPPRSSVRGRGWMVIPSSRPPSLSCTARPGPSSTCGWPGSSSTNAATG
jgi:hypothetical protein